MIVSLRCRDPGLLIDCINRSELLLPALYAERALLMGSTRVAWVSALPVHFRSC